MKKFIGRKCDLQKLEECFLKGSASLVVIQGRRRIGKSRLAEEFGKRHKFYQFAGIAPNDETTAQTQRDEFARQLAVNTGMPEIRVDNWSHLFLLFNEKIRQ